MGIVGEIHEENLKKAEIDLLHKIKMIVYQDYGLGCDHLLDELDKIEKSL